MNFTTALKVTKNLGYFCKIIYCQEISKIAQSGHTALLCVACLLSRPQIMNPLFRCESANVAFSLCIKWCLDKSSVNSDPHWCLYYTERPLPVWPDVEIKRSPNLTISSLKSSHRSFYLKGMFVKVAQKVKKIWAILYKMMLQSI